MQHWLDLLRTEVAANNDKNGKGGLKKTATRLGYSRTTVSLVIAGKYPGETDKVEVRVLERLGSVECPATAMQAMPYAECQMMRTREAPTHNPMQMRFWRQCQSCSNNPNRHADSVNTGSSTDTNHQRISMEEVA